MNPLDWTGPEFLSLYIPLLAGGLGVALLLRYFLRAPSGEPLLSAGRMDPYEVAALHGSDTLIEAVTASLFHRRVLRVDGDRLATGETLPSNAAPIERSVFECVATGNMKLETLRRALSPDVQHIQARLMRKGLLVDDAQALKAQLYPLMAYGAVLLLGLTKVGVGLANDRPVVYLVLLLCLGSLGLLFLWRRPWRSRLGDATLKALQSAHEPLRTTAMAGESSQALSGPDLALAVGLYGPALLIPMGYSDLRQVMHPPSASGSSSDSSSGGGSDSSCGGDSDGGGGGCGGCGGGGD
ncbi:TIGR04222 domain-containing membrane protein [Hyalangium gracile]|uniref:TIGR04222 domain-containing membrane protein n=1 Tax=Hyalangium gracile TaxID=394092 RepID=UPI001CC92BE5|nr:TIGR04222 domain-containing membrane protein [Hyalangium gracile]